MDKDATLEKLKQFNSDFLLKVLSRHYPLSDLLLERYSEILDWKELSQNTNLLWSVQLINNYKTKWDWEKLSSNSSLPWSTLLELVKPNYK